MESYAHQALPSVLYKYYPPDRIESALIDATLHFTEPAKFNDAFDSNYPIPSKATAAQAARLKFRRDTGIFCMTTKPDHQLMWVNYAAQHTGFVIGYDTSHFAFSEGGAILNAVEYSDEQFDVSDPNHPAVDDAFKKTKLWEYEDEWRCVRNFGMSESRDVEIGYEGILKVILGWKMEDHHVSRILLLAHAAEAGGHKIQICESEPLMISRRFKHQPSTRMICEKCGGSGHVFAKPAATGTG
jgi:hypothetical protein